MITVSAIKADIGGYVGHSSMHPDILALGREELEKARQRSLSVDSHATHCGDGLFLITTHERRENNEEVHRLARDTSPRGSAARGNSTGRAQLVLALIAALFGLAAVIAGMVLGRHRERVHQTLRELEEMQRRLDEHDHGDMTYLRRLLLALVGGFTGLATIITATVLAAVIGG